MVASHGQDGLRHRTYYSSNSTPHFVGRGPGRPVKTRGPLHGLCRAAHIKPTPHGPRPGPAHQIFYMMGRGPARPIKLLDDGPRPGPAHQVSTRWAAARPGPSNFFNSRPGPARPTKFSKFSARPGPAHQFFQTLGSARPSLSHFQVFRPGPARPITCSKFSGRPGPAHDNFQIGPARPSPHFRPMTCPAKYHPVVQNPRTAWIAEHNNKPSAI